jgi:hypothetical protein
MSSAPRAAASDRSAQEENAGKAYKTVRAELDAYGQG